MGLTQEQLQEVFKKLYDLQPVQEYKIDLPAYDYPTLSDKEFKAFVNTKGYHFIGGRKSVDLMLARCKKLNIK